jgi:hypothetical protein
MTIKDLISEFVAIGREDKYDRIATLLESAGEYRNGQFMRQTPQFWTDVAKNYSRDDLIGLIKVLTVAERDFPEFKAGSVSPVIWLYRFLRQNHPFEYTELEEWVLGHTDTRTTTICPGVTPITGPSHSMSIGNSCSMWPIGEALFAGGRKPDRQMQDNASRRKQHEISLARFDVRIFRLSWRCGGKEQMLLP